MPRWRRITAFVLLVVGAVLLPVSIMAVWVRNQVLDTGRYVNTVAPLAENKDIQLAAATRLTNAIMSQVNVEQLALDALPARADFLAAPLANGVQSYVQSAAEKLTSNPTFTNVYWKTANRLAHAQVKALLTGNSKTVKIVGDNVQLDLQPMLLQLRDALVSKSGLTILNKVDFSRVDTKFNIMQSKDLKSAQAATRLLNHAAFVLPLLFFASMIGAVLLAADRRRMLVNVGFAVALAAALLSVAIALGRSRYLDAVSSFVVSPAAAAAVYDTLLRNIRIADRIFVVIGLFVSFGALLAGPARWAVWTRSFVTGGATRAARSAGIEPGPIPRWFAEHLTFARIVPVGLAVVVLAMWDEPRPRTVLFLTLLVVIALVVIEALARIGKPATAQLSGATAPGDAP